MFFLANTGMFNISLVSVVHLIMPSPTLDSAFELSGEKKKTSGLHRQTVEE